MASASRFEELPNQVALVTFDLPDKKVNTLGRAVLAELRDWWAARKRTDLRGFLFRSGKPGKFIAGADLTRSGRSRSPKEMVLKAIEFGHAVLCSVSHLPFPTIALIDGNCMGGGTELVLSMDERIAGQIPAHQDRVCPRSRSACCRRGAARSGCRASSACKRRRDDLLGRARRRREGLRRRLRVRRRAGPRGSWRKAAG